MPTFDRLLVPQVFVFCIGATLSAIGQASGVVVTAPQAQQAALRLVPTDTPAPSALAGMLPAPSASASDASPVLLPGSSKPSPLASVDAAAPVETFRQRAGDLIENALGLVGVNYRRGGNTAESGLDCSGLVRLVFRDSMGIDLPRRAVEISRLGVKIGLGQLQPGDLVFYRTVRRTISHVGIYLGEGRFIHAPRAGEEVRVEDMNQPYWTKRFSEARRLGSDVN